MAENDSSSQEQQSGGDNGTNQTQQKTGGVKTVKLGDIEVPEDVLQAHIDSTIKDRINEVKDKERSKYKDYAELKAAKAKLEEIENLKKSEEEKALAKLKKLEEQIAEKEKALADRSLKDLIRGKIEKAIADGLMELPKGKTVSSLVARSKATNEDEVDSDLEDLIGFFPKGEPKPAPLNQGTGTQVANAPGTGKKTLVEQQQELDRMSRDMKLTSEERLNAAKQSLKIANRLMRGET